MGSHRDNWTIPAFLGIPDGWGILRWIEVCATPRIDYEERFASVQNDSFAPQAGLALVFCWLPHPRRAKSTRLRWGHTLTALRASNLRSNLLGTLNHRSPRKERVGV
jgi:hypothetical protein